MKSACLYHHAAVGIIINQENQILVSKRPDHKLKGGYWEFPGGKIESGESPEAALVRELAEEVGILVTAVEKFMQYQHNYEAENYKVLLDVFIIREYSGNPTALESQEIQWIKMTDFPNFKFLEPNRIIIDALEKL